MALSVSRFCGGSKKLNYHINVVGANSGKYGMDFSELVAGFAVQLNVDRNVEDEGRLDASFKIINLIGKRFDSFPNGRILLVYRT